MSKGESPSQVGLPDLYALLSLPPLENDGAKVERALLRLESLIQSNKLGDEKTVRKAQRILLLGKQHLSEQSAKQRYDQQWSRVYGQAATPASKPALQPAANRLDTLLPAGDPTAAFDLSQFLQNAQLQVSRDYENEFSRIQRLIEAAESSLEAGSDARVQVDQQLTAPSIAVSSVPVYSGNKSKHHSTLRRRRSRKSPVLFMIAGALGLIGMGLGFLYWQQSYASRRTNTTVAQVARPTESGAKPNELPPSASPRRSGLPQVRGLDEDSAPEPPAAEEQTPPVMEIPPQPEVTSMLVPSEPEMVESMTTLNLAASAMDSASTPGTETEKPQVTLSEEDKQAWQALLADIRKQTGDQKYELAAQKLSEAKQLEKTVQQTAQLARLNAATQLARELNEAMRQGIGGLGAGESITIGSSTTVGVVEVQVDQLTVRVRGQNQTYSFTEIPIGLAFALADLKLDAAAPQSKARKAAFTLFHPGAAGNDLALQRAKTMMAEAIAAKAVAEDLLLVFDEEASWTAPL